MFHKALWMRAFKQGGVVIGLLWVVSLYILPISYLSEANRVAQFIKEGDETYFYYFDYESTFLLLAGLLIALAGILIGGERNNQGMDFLFSMPFKRKDIYISKWLIGAASIAAITLVNMILMFIIQKTTIHGEYQTFTPFLNFFLFMFVALLTVYSLALFIGTITGGFVAQALLTIIASVLPTGLHTFISGAIGWHIIWMNGYRDLSEWIWTISDFFTDISIAPTIISGYFSYGQQWEDSAVAWVDRTVTLQEFDLPSFSTYIVLLVYLVATFLLGMFLYKRTPSENNGKIILYKKLEPIFLWCTVVCVALFGGEIGAGFSWNSNIVGYYFGFIVSGMTCYVILSRFIKKPLKLKRV